MTLPTLSPVGKAIKNFHYAKQEVINHLEEHFDERTCTVELIVYQRSKKKHDDPLKYRYVLEFDEEK